MSENACISLDNKKHVGLEKDTPTRRTRAKVPRPRDNFASTPRLASLIQRRRLNLPFSVADLLLSNSQSIPLSVSTLFPVDFCDCAYRKLRIAQGQVLFRMRTQAS
jgi:hypothetical protein